MRWKLQIVAGTLGLALAALGCGGSEPAPSPGGRGQATTAESGKASDRREPAVPRPLYPRCGVETFAAPAVSRGPGGGWRVAYPPPQAASRPAAPGQTALVNLEERPPKSTRVSYPNARTTRVRGRRVDLLRHKGAVIAQWVTKRARYVAITFGLTSAELRKIIGCTP